MDNSLDYRVQNKEIQEALVESIKSMFPIKQGNLELRVSNIRFEDNLDDYDFPLQREIKLNRKSWQIPVYADFEIVNTTNNNVVETQKNVKIAYIPKLTNRFSALIDGNEYQVVNQLRRKSGVYSRIKKNGELEAEFNLEKGKNFKMQLNPENQVFAIILDNRKFKVYNLLSVLGVSDEEIKKAWGNELFELNKKQALNNEASELQALYKKLLNKESNDLLLIKKELKNYFDNTKVSPETTKITLGNSYENVNGNLLLDSSKKLLNINKGLDKPDERDSLVFKNIYSVNDLLIEHFKAEAPAIKSKLERNLKLKTKIKEIINPGFFNDPIKKFFTVGDLSAPPPQTNPLTIVDNWRKTTPLGTGGIKDLNSITMETRDVHPSHFGFLDPLNTPESLKVGVTVGLSSEVRKIGKDLYTPVYDKNGKLHWLNPTQFYNYKVAFPDQYDLKNNKVEPLFDEIFVMHKGETKKVKANEVDYYLRSPKTLFSFSQNLVPFMQNTQGNRASTGSRMITQALALDDAEPPLVRVRRDDESTYEDLIGSFLSPESPVDGTIKKITDNYIIISPKENPKKEIKIGLYKDFPLNQDGFLNSKVLVKEGQNVKKGDVLTETNYSKGQTLALGKNLTVAYMSYKGFNFEDGAVLSESAAKKLSHTMLHKINVHFSPKISVFDKKKFNAWFPDTIEQENFKKLDDRGIIKVGEKVKPNEVVCAFLVEKELDDVEAALKKLDKFAFSNYMKNVTIWDEDDVGEVIDVRVSNSDVDIYIKSFHPLREGDKIAGRYGNKSIITKIVPDSEMPRRENGEVIDIIMSPEGVPGRMNIGQILETAAGKIAKKTGKPYIVDNFNNPNIDWAKKIEEDLKKHGIEVNEYLYDGKTGEKIKTPIFVGEQYILKLRHYVKKKLASHSYGTYDVDEQPAGKGVQKVGVMESYAYLAHGAKHNLYEIANIKGRKNEEYWRNLQFGLPTPPPERNFAFEKLITYLKGSGINVEKKGNTLQIMPLTDKDVLALSNGELKDAGAMLVGKNLASRKNGLFDAEITGGPKGTKWAHIELAERIPNPMFDEVIAKLLNVTEGEYENILKGKKELNGKTGTIAVVEALKNIDVDKLIKETEKELEQAPPTYVNKLNFKLKVLKALKDRNLTPEEAYTLKYIPVIPPVFRPIYALPSGDLVVNDVNKHYRDVALINNTFKESYKNLTEKDIQENRYELYYSVKALQGLVEPKTYSKEKYKGFLKQMEDVKTGLIHGTNWVKPQDLSGRSTIVFDPSLNLDEVGIPKEMAFNIYKPFIIRDLKEAGLSASAALKEYNEKTKLAENSLLKVMEERPVILNRAPTLHKHSVQAFWPKLTEERTIKLNPMIIKGFNVDADGDTMSVMVPIEKAAVEEAKMMLPSKILFKHGDFKLVPELSKDYLYGIYELSKINTHTGKTFKSIEEAKKAKIGLNDQFYLNGELVTIGQYYLNKPLPKEYRDYTRILNSKTVSGLLEKIAKERPDAFNDVISEWKNLGATYSYIYGHTVSLSDFTIDKSYRDKILKQELPKLKNLNDEEKVQKMLEITDKVEKAQYEVLKQKDSNLYKMYDSGTLSGSKSFSITQIASMPGVLTDINGKPLKYLFTKSYGEGFDLPSYWNTLYAVRKGTVDRAVNTRESGALNKSLLNVNRKLLVTTVDCNTKDYIIANIDDKDITTRVLAETYPRIAKRNDLITPEILMKFKQNNINEIKVRSPLTCEAIEGVCQKCYGLLPNGEFPEIGTNVGILESQAITERSTQLTMQTFHSGGSAKAGGGIHENFGRLEQLFKLPKKLSNKATLAEISGTVQKIEKNQIGGYTVTINNKKHTVLPGLAIKVNVGQFVNKGDPISEGIIKPQELAEFKSLLDAQKYLVDEGTKIYGNSWKKSFETAVKGISNNAVILEAPPDSGFLKGDTVSLSRIKYINNKRKQEGLPEIKYQPYFKSVDTLNTDDEDWFTRVTTNRIKAALKQGAAKHDVAKLKGMDPIPAYIYGMDFGKNMNPEKMEFY